MPVNNLNLYIFAIFFLWINSFLNNLNFAKIIAHGDRETYYVKYGRGDLLDPYHVDRLTHNRSFFDFKKVNKNIFDLYMEYLKSTSRIFLTRARRLMMEN